MDEYRRAIAAVSCCVLRAGVFLVGSIREHVRVPVLSWWCVRVPGFCTLQRLPCSDVAFLLLLCFSPVLCVLAWLGQYLAG